ncbi:MAG: hypothetical protein RBU25_19195, partial [Lentisphaeria bacterium]|nr:hypothetical protein [Lentisphaeria bacterium]
QIGLYFDEGSTGFLVEDNIVYDVAWNNCQIAQNRNTPGDHDIRTNYLAIRPDDPNFPKEIAAQAGVEDEWRKTVFPVTITPNPVYAMQWPELPEVPLGFSLDFEDVPLGRMPRRWSAAGFNEKGWFGVSDEQAASGTRCLKAQDTAGLAKSFYPYITHRVEADRGTVEFAFAFRQGTPPGEACLEFRDYRDQKPGQFAAGPSLTVHADGTLAAGQHELLTLPLDQWVRMTIRFTLGPDAKPEYTLAVTLPGQPAQSFALPFANNRFRTLTDLYIIAGAETDSAFYLDNLNLTLDK